ncbi:hypothetical protein Patl1_00738 [Pistacia atlantica]|uniref:Uncharacterized protein n=1 Tax=Pistacia atlantica TaxID=434234 RepID=A0ACC1C4B9_9ROSI|nr:hypothetical protein Patl1_00738 [Pistacia atlantica]
MLSWRILSPSSSPTMYCLSTTHTLSCTTITPSRDPTASLRLPETSMDEPLKSESKPKPNSDVIESTSKKTKKDVAPGDQDQEEEEQISISRIQVPRQKYISVSKAELLDAIVSVMFHSQDDRDQFLLIASCLDSILHAEHKSILEEMRNDYFFTDSAGDEGSISSDTKLENNGKENKSVDVVNTENSDPDSDIINRNGRINKYVDDEGEEAEPNELSPFNYGLDLWNLIGSPAKNVEKYNESRLAVSTRFQRAFMQLLNSAQFEELSATDLVLTSALNTDYLLTLPVYVDWKRASESNAIIFR